MKITDRIRKALENSKKDNEWRFDIEERIKNLEDKKNEPKRLIPSGNDAFDWLNRS